jgi:hypothetical protein
LRVLEGGAIGEWLLGGKNWGFAQVLDELWVMLAMIASFLINQACTHLLESLVVDEASCILGYVELTLLNVLAELPTKKEISVSPPGLQGSSDCGVHARQLGCYVRSEYSTRQNLVSA